MVCSHVCIFLTPGVLVGLASELDQSVGLGVPEEGTCRGLIELLRALRRELGVDGALREAAVGPSRPETYVEIRTMSHTVPPLLTKQENKEGCMVYLLINHKQ